MATPFTKFLNSRSIKHQINYINDIMVDGEDDRLQQRFPEGKLFSNAIFTLSILEFCENNDCSKEHYSRIVDKNIKRIISDSTLNSFNEYISPPYGMFYNGWANYVMKKYKRSELFKLSSIKELITEQSAMIEQRIVNRQKDSIRILDSYAGVDWPADNIIGLISIDDVIIQKKWLDTLLNTSESETRLIHHSGSHKGIIRGSSQSLIVFCLSEIGYDKIDEYNIKFKQTFVDDYLGVQLVRENEDGTSQTDFDSGPVIFGYGASATIMNIKTQANLNDKNAKRTWALMNTISFPITFFGRKYYLFKQEPMFDIFMLWASVELK